MPVPRPPTRTVASAGASARTAVVPAPDALVATHGAWLLAWLRVRGASQDLAEDIAQEVLLRLLRNHHRLREPGAVPAWLRVTATDLLARARRRRWPGSLVGEPPAPGPGPDLDPRVASLRVAVAALPDELEEVVLLRYSRSLTYEQIAAVLDVPRGTVQSRLRRAHERLRRALAVSGER